MSRLKRLLGAGIPVYSLSSAQYYSELMKNYEIRVK